MKADDSIVNSESLPRIREQALLSLQKAGACGRFPTPVDDVMAAAKIIIADENVLSASFLDKIIKKAHSFGKSLKSAVSKILGVIDVVARIVYIDKTVLKVKQVFIKLHETAHGVLVWQKDIYGVIQDCKKTLDPDVSDSFDREANFFASEVLFQLDAFEKEAADFAFNIEVPMKLSKKYGGSIYSTIRRYVSTNYRCCAVLVLNPPVLVNDHGFTAELRRAIPSTSFTNIFGDKQWPQIFTPNDEIGGMVPLGNRKMSRPSILILSDQNGIEHECVMESFSNSYQVFVLIHEIKSLTRTVILMP